ncbi:hypothetical protein F4859DRAFT_512010 [Xylaria cf. heliscus]|nr:hypothetical protein F4859DRAFT_512010 [Xylaria cf. heliscus]
MPATERVLYYDPSAQKVKTSDKNTPDSNPIPDGPQFQSLQIPPLCNTITVYHDWKTADDHSGTPTTAKEPARFALSRSRRIVNDGDLVAIISLKKQRDNSWFQRHSPVPLNYFDKIVIGPIDDRNTAVKESTLAENKVESPGDKSNPSEDGAALSSSQGTVENSIMPAGDKSKEGS